MTPPARTASSARTIALALLADVASVVVFAAVGRASHAEGAWGIGLLQTSWPFLASLALGWLASRAWRAPLAVVRVGLPVWAITVTGGMLLRTITGAGTAVAFVIVAALSLLVLLVGWRAAVAGIRHLRLARQRQASGARG